MDFLITIDFSKFLNVMSERFSFFDDVFIRLDVILMNDRINSVDTVNDGVHFVFWFGDKGFESELEIVELDGHKWVHELVDLVEFLIKLLLLLVWPSCKYLNFLLQVVDPWNQEVVVLIKNNRYAIGWRFYSGILFKDKVKFKLPDFLVFGLELLIVLKY